jgi:superfamily I DNA/RNA helicase
VVALHRAARLAKENPKARILLTTFSPALAELLQLKLSRLLDRSGEAFQRIEVRALDELAEEWFAEGDSEAILVESERLREIVTHAGSQVEGHSFTPRFLYAEWRYFVDAWQIKTREDYLATPRTGRKSRVSAAQREVLWEMMAKVRQGLLDRSLTTWAAIYDALTQGGGKTFDHIIVDEAQDLSVAQLRFLSGLVREPENGLFLAGDLGQRIFQHPFSWKALGINLQGRSHILRVNYRTSEALRRRADQLLPTEVRDFDGESESRLGTVSLFNGPVPVVTVLDSRDGEISHVSETILRLLEGDLAPDEIGLFVRGEKQLAVARAALKQTGRDWSELERTRAPKSGSISLSTMHLAKGLEFRAVVIMACDDEIIPSQERIEGISDQDELEEVYITERHLLYVACTRAREQLFISATDPESEFLSDLF